MTPRIYAYSASLGLFAAVFFTPQALLAQEIAAANATVDVRIDNFTFTPPEVTIPAGAAVTWTNGDDIPHTVVATNKAFRSKVFDTDGQFTFVFTQPGTYEYFCSLHPHMKGMVIVK